MDEYEDLRGSSKRQIFLVVLIVTILYILLLGQQGTARDVVLDAGLAYIATGSQGGLRIADVRDPAQPREIGFYDTPGSARKIALVGYHAFIADGKAGMRILDVSDPTAPVALGSILVPGETVDVAVAGNYAYLASESGGISIVDVSNRLAPILVSTIETPGRANGAAIMQVFMAPEGIVPGSLDFTQQAKLQATYVYVADGPQGVTVIDATVPINPMIIGSYNTSGNALDIEMTSYIGFLADGRAGVRILDLRNPAEPAQIVVYDTPGYAYKVKLVDNRLYVADGDEGYLALNVSNLAAPEEVERYPNQQDVFGLDVSQGHVFLAAGDNGVRVIGNGSQARPFEVGVYSTPGDASLDQIINGAAAILTQRYGEIQPKVGRTILAVIFDFVLFLTLLIFWLAVFAQFVLPVRRWNERWPAIKRILAYFVGRRGPAIFIENGKIHSRLFEKERVGPGVAILDTASAAVFRTEHSFTRAVGPGIVFTNRKEVPAGVIDLRRQLRRLGPLPGEDPFVPRREDESEEEYEARQTRRYETSGLTRDGVEIVPNINISFGLDALPGAGGTQFGYNSNAVWKAIAREGINPRQDQGSDRRRISWAWLPARMAVDLWREHLRKFTLVELFSFTSDEKSTEEPQEADTPGPPLMLAPGIPDTGGGTRRVTAFNIIMDSIRARMSELQAHELDETGQLSGTTFKSKEHQILKGRGIKVFSVSISNLRFPEEIETQLVEQWEASWLDRAQGDAKEAEILHAHKRLEGQDLALKEFAAATSQMLGSYLSANQDLDLRESLRMLVQGTLRLGARQVELSPRLTNQKAELVELIEWIGKQ